MTSEQSTTPVDVITQDCRYSGSVATRGYRVSDLLSDSSTEILEMWETLTSIVGGRSTDVRWKQIFLKKNRILLVVPKGSYEAPLRRCNNYVEKDHYGAMIILPGYILSGIVHLPPRATPLMLLDENSPFPSFMGVTDVTLHNTLRGFCPSPCEVVIVRRRSIESVQLTAQPLPKPEGIIGAAEKGAPSPLSCPK